MAAEYFNSLGGFSVGIPAIEVIDSSGNVVTNVLALTGNVSANKIYANSFYYANGSPLSGGGGNGVPGGSNSAIQYNNAGNFGGSNSFTFNSVTELLTIPNVNINGTANLGNISNIAIFGGSPGYVLSTDGNGVLSWTDVTSSPGGSNTQLQFNDNGIFNGSSTLTFNKNTNTLTASNISASDINVNTIDANIVEVANIVNSTNVNVSTRLNVTGTLRATGDVNFTGSPNVTLGAVGNLKISGGANGYILTTDGTGNLSWQEGGGSGNTEPAGSNTQIQFNNNGLFGASPYFTFNNSNNTVQIAGNLIANTVQMGAGVYKFSTSEVYFAVTVSTAKQVLYSIPAQDISGAEFHIIATDATSGSRQSSKISSVIYNGQVQYNEYAGLYINGGVGSLEVDYNAGNIITPSALELRVTPDSSNQIVYKMLITVFS